jgi:GntR family transcriptional regulator/MocR family aminotransferase
MLYPPFIALDEESGAPLYRQIYEAIRGAILTGEFAPRNHVPASRFLARQLGVSRTTVVNTYDQLIAEGYLESRKGSGTFVAAHLPEEFLITRDGGEQSAGEPSRKRELGLSVYARNVSERSGAALRGGSSTPAVAFQHGLAGVDEFPFDVWTKLANKVYRTLSRNDFGYGDPAGFYPLRVSVADYLKSARALNCSPEQVIITTGAQHAFDLIGRILLNRDSGVLIEDPCYPGAREAFRSFGSRLVPVPVDERGFNLSAVPEAHRKARLAYVTPSHQFPLGVTMSLSRRLELLEWAENTGSWIVEDDYDSDFRYGGRPLASLQGLDRNRRVLYIGTFSKTIFPALRLGCLVVPPDFVKVVTAVRALSSSHAALIDQATLAEFISGGDFMRHLRRMRRLYEKRQDTLIAEAKKHLSGLLEIERSVSGMHLVGWLPDGVEDTTAAEGAAADGVNTNAVSSYSLTKWRRRGGLVLGYTGISETQIGEGVVRLARSLEGSIGRRSA